MKPVVLLTLPVLLAAPFLFPHANAVDLPTSAEHGSATSAKPTAFAIDANHSWILFKVGHLNIGTAWGSFGKFSGSFALDSENMAESSVSLEIEAGSVSTNNSKRDDHLKGPDFFNVREFPSIRFQSKSVTGSADEFTVTGTLELLGKKKDVEVKMTKVGEGKDPWGNYRAGFEGAFQMDRTDFGMDFMKEGLGTDISVTLAFEATRDS